MRFSPDTAAAVRRVVDVLVDAVVLGLVVLGVVQVLQDSGWGVLWLALALVGLAAQLAQTGRTRGRGWSPLGRAQVMRAGTLAGTAVALAVTAPGAGAVGTDQALAATLAAAALVSALVCEPFIARAVRYRVPVARLPGVPSVRTRRDLGPQAVLASLLANAVGLALAAAGASAWWWLPVALLAVVPTGWLAVTGRAKILAARRVRATVHQAVADYAPDFVVYTSRPDDASYQVTMWLPYLQRAGLRFLVVTRNAAPAAALVELTDIPVVQARGIADLEALVVPSLKAAFYVNASSGNGGFVRFQHLTHVYLGHGDSDKPPSYNPTHAMYDQVFAAGPAATRRYAAHGVQIPAEKFRIVGRPQVEDVHPATRSVDTVAQPVVLYAPTWRGHVEETMLYSLPGGERIVAALLARGATVVFRPHPFSYDFPEDAAVIRRIHAQLTEDARRTGRDHLYGAAAETERGILDCINASDAMVSDVSSVVSDYLFSRKPFAMIAVPAEPDAFVAEFPVAAASYVVRGDLADLEPQLAAMLGPDPLSSTRAALRADYLGDVPDESYADVFVQAVRDAAARARTDLDAGEEDRAELDDGGAGGAEPSEASEASEIDEADGGEPDEGGRPGGLRRYRRVLTRVGLDLAATGVALVALGAALLGAPTWAVTVLVLLATWAALQSASRSVRRASRRSRLLTEGDATRAVLLVTVAVQAARQDALGWPVLVFSLVVAVALVAERRIRAHWGRFGLIAVNLPDAVQPTPQLVGRGWLPLASFATLAVGSVLLAAGSPAGPLPARVATGIVAGAAALFGLVFLHVLERSLRRASKATAGDLRLRGALEAHAPAFAVYFASTEGARYQVGMWLPYFAQVGRPFVIVTRSVSMLRQLAQLCEEQGVEVPIVYRPSLRSLEDVIVPSLTAAFYVNNAVRNTHFIERRELTHVWLNHGDSEKPACFNPVHAIYDLIFAAGQAGIDRYARHGVHIPREKFLVVGRPQVEQIEPARGAVLAQQPPTVLYAPTWQGPYADTRVYSLPVGAEIVQQLLDRGVRVVFRAHPFNYRYAPCRQLIAGIGALLDADRARTGREHLWGRAAEQELSVEDCFNVSDAMVADVSAVVSDYLRSEKPFAMVAMGRTPEQLVVEAPAAQAAYVLREDLSNLGPVLDDLLGDDPLAPTRRATRVYYLGDFAPGTDADGFLNAARDVVEGRYATAEAAAHLQES